MNIAELGAIFDWDGVVIDSARQHEEAWDRLAEEEGRTLPPGHFKKGFGKKNEVIIPEVIGWAKTDPEEIQRLARRKEAIYREILAETGIEALPGVKRLLDALSEAGVPCAVGSSTARLNIEAALAIMNLRESFQAIVCGDDVNRGKPDPEVFLTAAARIERAPSHCVVFEDAHVGIEAALAGGMKTVAIATTNPLPELNAAHRAVASLSQLELLDIQGLWER